MAAAIGIHVLVGEGAGGEAAEVGEEGKGRATGTICDCVLAGLAGHITGCTGHVCVVCQGIVRA